MLCIILGSIKTFAVTGVINSGGSINNYLCMHGYITKI